MALTSIIKFEGSASVLIYKYPEEDFNTTSQLIVHESQEAIFFRNGQALDLFPAGRYTLETQNIPLIKGLLTLPTSGISPFHCEVYFINLVTTLNLKWGTNTSSEVLDPQFKILLNIGASGGLGLRVVDSRKLLLKLLGTGGTLAVDQLQGYFREVIAMRVKTYLTRIMSLVSFVVINQSLEDISTALTEKLSSDLSEFGVKLVNFYISTIHIPDEDKEKVKDALAKVSARSIEGISWAGEQVADIAKRYASNEGASSNVAGMISQTPLAFAFGQMLSSTVTPMIGSHLMGSASVLKPSSGMSTPGTDNSGSNTCIDCGASFPTDYAYCPKCGKKADASEVFCGHCGRKLLAGENFCPSCGTKRLTK